MARTIYEIKLKKRYYMALNVTEVVELHNCNEVLELNEGDVDVVKIVQEEDTVKIGLLAKTMYDNEKFEYEEIRAAVHALAYQLGYRATADEVAECILNWVECVGDGMTLGEFEEWMIG